MQAAAPFANVPTGHVSAVNAQEEAPAALYAPVAQLKHADDAPSALLYVPAAHTRQASLDVPPALGL